MSDSPSGPSTAPLRPACDPATELDARFRAAIRTVMGGAAAAGNDGFDPQIRVSGNAKFGERYTTDPSPSRTSPEPSASLSGFSFPFCLIFDGCWIEVILLGILRPALFANPL